MTSEFKEVHEVKTVKRGRPRKSGSVPKASNAPTKKLRKLIDLPLEALPKLSMLAAAEGKSLKAYIEWLAIEKAKTVKDEQLAAGRDMRK